MCGGRADGAGWQDLVDTVCPVMGGHEHSCFAAGLTSAGDDVRAAPLVVDAETGPSRISWARARDIRRKFRIQCKAIRSQNAASMRAVALRWRLGLPK